MGKLVQVLSLFLLFLCSCHKSEMPSFSQDEIDAVNAAVQNVMTEMDVPGVVMGIYVPGKGEIILNKGLADIQNNIISSPFKIFRIGDVTQTFTALTLLQLVDDNKLSLDDKLSLFEPRIPNAGNITVRMLLNHTSGIFSYTDDPAFIEAVTTYPLRSWSYEELIAITLTHPAAFEPGQGYENSYTDYILLGLIIETVTGNPATTEINTNIVFRLGLKNTSMAEGAVIQGNYAHGYTFDLDGSLRDISQQESATWGWTSAGMYADLTDLKICAKAFATGRLLSASLKNEFTNWIPIPVQTGAPQDYYTGLGIMKYKDVVGMAGSIYGYTSWMWYMPENQSVLIAFFNQTSVFTPERKIREQELLTGLLNSILEIMR